MLDAFRTEFRRYEAILARALAQCSDEDFDAVPGGGGNSIAVILAHLAGNLRSRFTEFLTTDGEKAWRDRDAEFAPRRGDRAAGMERWREAWAVVDATLDALTDADLPRTVTIRSVTLSVADALARSSAHFAHHVGQIVLLARMRRGADWQWISIPPGKSTAYNAAPDQEKGLRPRG